jgi:hypothetical protein
MEWNKRKHEGHSVSVHNKKPYYGDVRPGQEYQEPRLYQQPNYSYDDGRRRVSSSRLEVLAACQKHTYVHYLRWQ